VSVDLLATPKVLVDDRGDNYFAETVIIATGSKPNKLGLKDEDKYV
jgi:thioredoxin reductase